MTNEARLGTAALALALAGCANVGSDDLPDPQLIMTEGELCAAFTIVDGDDAVWFDSGCEGDAVSLERVGTVTLEERAELDAEADAILSMPPAPCALGEPEIAFRVGARSGTYCSAIPEVEQLAHRLRVYRGRGP